VPVWLCGLIARLHAKNPDDRFSSASEVADLLARGLNDDPPTISCPAAEDTVEDTSPTLHPRRRRRRRWPAAAAVVGLLAVGLGLAEATEVIKLRAVVIRLLSSDGTLVIEVDAPDVSVAIDGTDVKITGAGLHEIRLKAGQYKLEASKDGKLVSQELFTVVRNGRQIVRVSKEALPPSDDERWEKSVAGLPAAEQVEAVARRLRERNPKFTSGVEPTIRDEVVVGLRFNTDRVADLSPLRALTRLEELDCRGSGERVGMAVELAPLRGLPLKYLNFADNHVTDLSPLKGMPLKRLFFARNIAVKDLTPLKGMPLEFLDCSHTCVDDLSPLKESKLTVLCCDVTLVSDLKPLSGMPLTELYTNYTRVSDLKPLRGMPLEILSVISTPVADLSPLQGIALKEVKLQESMVTDLSPLRKMPLTRIALTYRPEQDGDIIRSLKTLQSINGKGAAEFLKEDSK
jgi:hypothetical protein